MSKSNWRKAYHGLKGTALSLILLPAPLIEWLNRCGYTTGRCAFVELHTITNATKRLSAQRFLNKKTLLYCTGT